MSHARVVASEFNEELHHRAPAGSSTGGQFSKSDGGGSPPKPATKPPRKAAPAKTTPKRRPRTQRRDIPKGQLGFDGLRGTGYGMRHGDPRVRSLQEELNRLGLRDSRGRKLAVDGKLGPLTTQAIEAAQVRWGMTPTGIISEAFIARLKAAKSMPKAPPRRAVKATFDPSQPRDAEGKWSALAGKALATLRKFGEVLEAEKWGDHDDKDGLQGWMTLHADGDVVLSYRLDDGDAKPFLTGADLSHPDDWREFASGLREAADAAEAEDEDFDPISATGYDIGIDPADGTVSVDVDRTSDGFIADPGTVRGLADRVDEFADHLERYNDGEYEAKVPDTFTSSGPYSSDMDWTIVDADGNRSFEVTGDDGGTVQMDLSAAEMQGLRDALADFAKSGGFFPGDDGRYFDWSTVDRHGRRTVEIGSPDGDVTQVEMTDADMRGWLAALSATLGTKVAAKFDPSQPHGRGKVASGFSFAIDDRIRVAGTPHEPGQSTGTIALVHPGPAYGIRFDPGGDDDAMAGEVHKWYVGDELAALGARAQMSAVAAKFDPSQPRADDGTWSRVGGAIKDALKLAGRIDLGDGESLHSSGRLETDGDAKLLWAVVDSPHGRQIRLAAIPEEEIPKWRAADKGGTSSISPRAAAHLRDDLADADVKGKAAAKRSDTAYKSGTAPTDPVLTGDKPVAEGTAAASWGDIGWSTHVTDDDPASWQTDLQFGSNSEGLDPAALDPRQTRAFIKQLDAFASAPVAASAGPTHVLVDGICTSCGY